MPPLILGILFFSPPFLAAAAPTKYKALRQQAEFYERQADWDKACLAYENILRLDRGQADVQERYQICLRRYWQVKRHSDPSFRKEVLSLDYAQSLRLYEMIRDTLLDNALDKKKTDPGSLFRKGMEEFDNALTDPYFLQQYLPAARPHDIRVFRDFLRKTWDLEEKITRPQAFKQLRAVALAAQNMLQLSCNVVFMEFACGACHALDEYTLYLTPNQLRALCDSLRGEFAGVGMTVRLDDNRVLINEVIPYSPAGEVRNPPLAKDDQVMSIDKKPVLSAEATQELLDGPVGTSVDLEVYSPGMATRTVTLRRRNLYMPSVSYHMKDDRIGYLHLACFQDTTVREIEDALAALAKDGMQAVLLDIRGNNGGVFEAAIEVARRFLSSGVIASTQNSDPRYNTVYHARNPNALTAPLVVLIDGETASAAEVLAGALKDNKRGRLVGQTTFGKGCTQCVLKLPPAAGGVPTGGMRLTVAQFFSPAGLPYSGRGVLPHVVVEPLAGATDGIDQQMEAALLEIERLLNSID